MGENRLTVHWSTTKLVIKVRCFTNSKNTSKFRTKSFLGAKVHVKPYVLHECTCTIQNYPCSLKYKTIQKRCKHLIILPKKKKRQNNEQLYLWK